MKIEGVLRRLRYETLLSVASRAADALRRFADRTGWDYDWLYAPVEDSELARRVWARRVIAEAVLVEELPMHPAGWGADVVMELWPHHVEHLICESLGYCTPTSAANIISDAMRGRSNWCEWIADMAVKRATSQKRACGDEVVRECTRDVVKWAIENKTISVSHRFSGRRITQPEITPAIRAEIDKFRDEIRADENLRGRDHNYKDVTIPDNLSSDGLADLYLSISVSRGGRRRSHKGYMADMAAAKVLVERATAGKGEPVFASWF